MKQQSTHRLPWVIHTAAFFYGMPSFFMLYCIISSQSRIDALSVAISFTVIVLPALFAVINLRTLYHSTRRNRWIPIATALIGIAGLTATQLFFVPWLTHALTSLSDETYRSLLLVIDLSFVFALTTVCNAIMLFGHPLTRKYLLQVPVSA